MSSLRPKPSRWFKSSACTEAEAGAWLSERVRYGKLKLLWTERNPEYLTGLHLTEETFIYIPCFPGARAIDEIDWTAGKLRRRLRYPKIVNRWGGGDPSKLTQAEVLARDQELRARHGEGLLACYGSRGTEPEEWVTEELMYRFTVRRASLVAILDRASVPLGTLRVPLAEAGEIIANRFNLSRQMGLEAIVEAAASERIEIYGKPQPEWQRDRTDPGIWRRAARGEAALSDAALVSEPAGVSWSDPYVFRADLERLLQELASDGTAAGSETGTTEASASAITDLSQSEKAKLRRQVQEFLEVEAKKDPPRFKTKAEWRQLVREESRAGVTDNLFDEVWREADLPAAWRAPGRRT